jgi:hypothetical protein
MSHQLSFVFHVSPCLVVPMASRPFLGPVLTTQPGSQDLGEMVPITGRSKVIASHIKGLSPLPNSTHSSSLPARPLLYLLRNLIYQLTLHNDHPLISPPFRLFCHQL